MKFQLGERVIRYALMAVFVVGVSVAGILSSDWDSAENWTKYVAVMSGVAAIYAAVSTRHKQDMRKRRHVYIIASSANYEFAQILANLLRKANYSVSWQGDIIPGQKIATAVNEAIESSGVAIYLSSKDAKSDILAAYQLHRALSTIGTRDRALVPVIPFLLDSAPLPDSLGGIQSVDGSEGFLDRLDAALQYHLDLPPRAARTETQQD